MVMDFKARAKAFEEKPRTVEEAEYSWASCLNIVENLAELFPEHETMETMDAAEFKDNAVKIWELVERARNLLEDG